MRALVIGGIEIPLRSSELLTQDYTPLFAKSGRRTSNGTRVTQTVWSGKLATTIRGQGAAPAGLQGLNYNNSIIIKCIQDRRITSQSNIISVPSARRSDYGVEGRAFVGNQIVSTSVAMNGDEATLDIVAGATAYQAMYWPELICDIEEPSESGQVRGARYGWVIEAEQI